LTDPEIVLKEWYAGMAEYDFAAHKASGDAVKAGNFMNMVWRG
jgi:hypothetical protein